MFNAFSGAVFLKCLNISFVFRSAFSVFSKALKGLLRPLRALKALIRPLRTPRSYFGSSPTPFSCSRAVSPNSGDSTRFLCEQICAKIAGFLASLACPAATFTAVPTVHYGQRWTRTGQKRWEILLRDFGEPHQLSAQQLGGAVQCPPFHGHQPGLQIQGRGWAVDKEFASQAGSGQWLVQRQGQTQGLQSQLERLHATQGRWQRQVRQQPRQGQLRSCFWQGFIVCWLGLSQSDTYWSAFRPGHHDRQGGQDRADYLYLPHPRLPPRPLRGAMLIFGAKC